MGTNEISPEIGTAPAALQEQSETTISAPRCGQGFRFWRCLACGINWRIDYDTELCESCFARIFPPEC